MSRSLIVVLPDLTEDHIARIRNAADQNGFECLFFEEPSQSLPGLMNAEVILGGDPFLSRHAPNLRWICSPSAGINQFTEDQAFANPSAVLTNSSGAYGVTIAEHIIMLLLEILRRQPEYQAHVAGHEWFRRLSIRSIYGSRITLLGTGDIGQETVLRLRGFAPKQITGINRSGRNPGNAFDRILRSGDMNRALPETDILIISLPGTPDTLHMIGRGQLALLPDHGVIINVGRGAVIDEKALEEELRKGRLFAGLDVFETEPIPADSALWDCPRLIITPHVAGDTTLLHTLDRIVDLFLEDFENYCAGRPLIRMADRGRGY